MGHFVLFHFVIADNLFVDFLNKSKVSVNNHEIMIISVIFLVKEDTFIYNET